MNHHDRTPSEDPDGLGQPHLEGGAAGEEQADRLEVDRVDPDLEEDVGLAEDDGSLGEALRTLLRPPDAIGDRVAGTVSEHLASRSTGGVALDLLGLGARTLVVFLTGEAPPADRNPVDVDIDGAEQTRRVTG